MYEVRAHCSGDVVKPDRTRGEGAVNHGPLYRMVE